MGLIKSIGTVIGENRTDRKRLVRLALFDLKNDNGGLVPGFLLYFLFLALQTLVYWFVFVFGLGRSDDIGSVPYIIWLIVGVIPWFFMSECMIECDKAISSYSEYLKRMTFPIAILPVKTVIKNFIMHFISVIIAFITVAASGVHIGNQLWQIVYYLFSATFFLIAYSFVGSSLFAVFKNYHGVISFIIRMMFFISPVAWNPDESNTAVRVIMTINPFAYIINGYRNAMFYSESLLLPLKSGIIFWCLSLVMFTVGCLLHTKLRRKFADLV